MEKKMMMPANYNVMNEDEMTYTVGGADANAWLSGISIGYGVVGLAAAALSIFNLVWAIDGTRTWIRKNKTTSDNAVNDVVSLAVKGLDATINYASKSIWNAVVAVYSASNLAGWWPVTAIAWLTA